MARSRGFNVFSLSFLDIMSCGFGAVVLIYLIINHATEVEFRTQQEDLYAEIRKLDYEVDVGETNLADVRQSLSSVERRLDEARRRRVALTVSVEDRRKELTRLQADTLAKVEHLNQLKSDVESRTEDVERMKASTADDTGERARTFVGEGDRQYLTGLKVGGDRIFIAVDTSASMLDETIVNVLRRRNMDDSRKLAAPKWRRAVATVEWVVAQLPLEGQFQLYGFAEQAAPIVSGTEGQWLDVTSRTDLDRAIDGLKQIVPTKGTSLKAVVDAIESMRPAPDNIILIVDGLPTIGDRAARSAMVSGRDRLRLFNDAADDLPLNIPVNVILFPMEGDPYAAGSYWGLAHVTKGSFLSPSKDWP